MKYNKETCTYLRKNRPHLNSRYKHFTQFHFTAGDEEQFFDKIFPSNFTSKTDNLKKSNRMFYRKFKGIDASALTYTFRYIFYKLKKGVYIRIQNNKIKIFLPFSNVHYVNEWSKNIELKEPLKKQNINTHLCYWYGNNGLVRYEYPPVENDSDVEILYDMFSELCEQFTIPDIEFFLNKRDFPLLKKDETETYDNMFGDNIPLQSHNYPSYLPILGMTTTTDHADIPIPTWEHWTRCVYLQSKKHFPSNIRTYSDNFSNILWTDKKEKAVFRGQSSGINTSIQKNIRLKLCCISHPLLDVGITKLNKRVRFNIHESNHLQYINKDDIIIKSFLSSFDQAHYKYIINVDGHTISYRLGRELQYGSVVLWARSKYELWYTPLLKPYVHYVPIKEDLTDLIDQIKWCKNNDEKCKTIALNGLHFYHTHLTQKKLLQFLQQTLSNLSKWVGSYSHRDTSRFIYNLPLKNKFKEIQYEKNLICKKEKVCMYHAVIQGSPTYIKQKKNALHENIVGLKCINPLNSKHFITTNYHHQLNKYILTDEIKGTFFDKYIAHPETSFQKMLIIIRKIAYQIRLAQRRCYFVHNDLYAWNILIDQKENPIIFDFDKSQFVYNKKLYTTLSFIHFNEFYDIFTLLISSFSIYLSNHNVTFLNKLSILKLMNILKETPLISYFFNYILHKDKSQFNHLYEVKIFCKFVKKYNVMLYALRNGWIINLKLDDFLQQNYKGEMTYPIYDIQTEQIIEKNFFNKFNNIL